MPGFYNGWVVLPLFFPADTHTNTHAHAHSRVILKWRALPILGDDLGVIFLAGENSTIKRIGILNGVSGIYGTPIGASGIDAVLN